MKYRFISAHKIIGVTKPAGRVEEIIAEIPDLGSRALITYDVSDHLFEVDRGSAVASSLIMGLLSGRGKGDSGKQWPRMFDELRERREKEIGSGVFVVFEAVGEVDSWDPGDQTEFDDFTVVFDATFSTPIDERHQASINGILSSLIIGSKKADAVKKVAEGIYFFGNDDRPVHSFTLKAVGGKVTVSSGLEPDAIEYAKQNAAALGQRRELSKPIGLLVRSLNEESDDLFSFLSAWFGLEILVNKIFRSYESEMFERFASTIDGTGQSSVVGRIREVMKGRYNIADKFAVASLVLAPGDADNDISLFKDVKDVRDNLMHGGEVSLEALPIEDTRRLFRKLIRLHLGRTQG